MIRTNKAGNTRTDLHKNRTTFLFVMILYAIDNAMHPKTKPIKNSGK